jgi:chromosome segregation ATPase
MKIKLNEWIVAVEKKIREIDDKVSALEDQGRKLNFLVTQFGKAQREIDLSEHKEFVETVRKVDQLDSTVKLAIEKLDALEEKLSEAHQEKIDVSLSDEQIKTLSEEISNINRKISDVEERLDSKVRELSQTLNATVAKSNYLDKSIKEVDTTTDKKIEEIHDAIKELEESIVKREPSEISNKEILGKLEEIETFVSNLKEREIKRRNAEIKVIEALRKNLRILISKSKKINFAELDTKLNKLVERVGKIERVLIRHLKKGKTTKVRSTVRDG